MTCAKYEGWSREPGWAGGYIENLSKGDGEGPESSGTSLFLRTITSRQRILHFP
jgi:hypothetical protein